MPINGNEMDPRREPRVGDKFIINNYIITVQKRHGNLVRYAQRYQGTTEVTYFTRPLSLFSVIVKKAEVLSCNGKGT